MAGVPTTITEFHVLQVGGIEMPLNQILLWASTVGWILSSIFWFRAALIPPLIHLPTSGREGVFRLSTGKNKEPGSTIINGIEMPSHDEIRTHAKKTKFTNGAAAALSGISALLSACTILVSGV